MGLFASIVAIVLLVTLLLISSLRESRCKRCGGRFAWRETGAHRARSGFWVTSSIEVE